MATGTGSNRGGYKRWDLDKLIFRGDGGASAEKIKSDPKMAGTRQQNNKFGSCSVAGKLLRDAILDVSDLGHTLLSSEITRLCTSIMDLDESTPHGAMPTIVYSRGAHLLDGYNLNSDIVFESVLSTPVQFTFERSAFKASVQLPPLQPGINFRNPWNQPFFRIKINLGILRDMAFDGYKFKPITDDAQDHTLLEETEWLSTKDKYPAQSFELAFEEPVFDENCHLILGIGIEFGTMKKGGIEGSKRAKVAKILGLG